MNKYRTIIFALTFVLALVLASSSIVTAQEYSYLPIISSGDTGSATVTGSAQSQSQTAESAKAGGCTTRPLEDFIAAQGSTVTFFPPVKDILASTDADFVYFALVDYAGVANEYIVSETGVSLGTEMSGTVLECPQADGRARISVVLNTRKALGFAQSVQDLIDSGFDFLNTPTIFGNKAQDVVNGAEPAVGPVSLRATFHIAASGDPLPDIRLLYQGDLTPFAPAALDLRSTTIGTLPDGQKARLRVQQVGATATNEAGEPELIFSREIVDLNR